MIRNKRIGSASALVHSKPNTALYLVHSSRFAQRLAGWLVIGLFVAVVAMTSLRWQQTSRGSGKVVAYVPQERQQSVDSPVKGIVAKIADGLVEGSKVKKGDFLVEIQPFAPNMVDQLTGQVNELKQKLETENSKAEVYGRNILDFTDAGSFAVTAAEEMVESAKAKLESKQDLIPGYRAKRLQARLNYQRQKSLFDSGLKPAKEIEKLKKELDVATSDLESTREDVEALKKELEAKRNQLKEKQSLAKTKIDYARAMQQDALGKAATIRKEIREVEVKLSEFGRRTVTAPRDGTIYRMPVFEQNQAIKQGESILTLVPETTQKAVELFINGNDLPLVQLGQEVRLQFEGWPAVQFAGWPSLSIGVFSGKVATIDPTDNGKGQFRILVLPHEDKKIITTTQSKRVAENEQADKQKLWPEDRYLRQGVRANGWVNMRRVSLGYEIWRQLNGFPIMLEEGPGGPRLEKGAKPPKVPK